MAQTHGHSVDEYLETIYFLAFPIGEYRPATGSTAIASRVAEMLGVSRASAGEMLKRLEADGLVERGEQKEAILTPGGRRAREARRAQAPHHRALPHGLHGLHGRRVARARGRARRHVHGRDDRADQRAPRAVPTAARTAGRSTPSSSRPRTRSSSRSRSSPVGRDGQIVRLAEHDGDLLHWFYDEGLVPGSQVAVVSAQPAAGQLMIAVDGAERAITERAADGIYVRAA